MSPSAAGLLCDLLWADPDKEIQGWGENDRGVSYTFGPDSVSEFLTKHDLDLVCRAHQVSFSAAAGAAAKPTGAACCFPNSYGSGQRCIMVQGTGLLHTRLHVGNCPPDYRVCWSWLAMACIDFYMLLALLLAASQACWRRLLAAASLADVHAGTNNDSSQHSRLCAAGLVAARCMLEEVAGVTASSMLVVHVHVREGCCSSVLQTAA